MVRDGDLNVINQIKEENRWMVTPTYHYPALHDHGVVMLWLPFYAYTRMLEFAGLEIKTPERDAYRSTMVLANSFFFILLLIMSFKLFELFPAFKLSKLELTLLTLGTPLFWYGLVHPSSSDVSSAFFPFLFLCVHFLCLKKSSKKLWFFYGLLLSLGAVTKVSLVLYFALPFHFLIQKENPWLASLKKYLPLFLGGCFSVLIPYLANLILKYGSIEYSYLGIVSPYNLFWEIILGPAGYFYVSPLYLIIIGFFIRKIYLDKEFIKKNSLYCFLLFAALFKIILESNTYQANADFGARHLIVDHLTFLLLFPSLYLKDSLRKIFLALASLATCFTLLMSFVFMEGISPEVGFEWGILYASPINAFQGQIGKYLYFLKEVFNGFSPDQFVYYLKYLPLIFFGSIVLRLIYSANLLKENFIERIGLFFLSSYLLVTLINLSQANSNAKKMKAEGLFAKTIVANGPAAYYFEDNVGNLLMSLKFSKMRKDPKMYKKVQQEIRNYYEVTEKQILIDPVNFKESMNRGTPNFPDPF